MLFVFNLTNLSIIASCNYSISTSSALRSANMLTLSQYVDPSTQILDALLSAGMVTPVSQHLLVCKSNPTLPCCSSKWIELISVSIRGLEICFLGLHSLLTWRLFMRILCRTEKASSSDRLQIERQRQRQQSDVAGKWLDWPPTARSIPKIFRTTSFSNSDYGSIVLEC